MVLGDAALASALNVCPPAAKARSSEEGAGCEHDNYALFAAASALMSAAGLKVRFGYPGSARESTCPEAVLEFSEERGACAHVVGLVNGGV